MSIEEAEEIFGKKWDYWDKNEKEEFIQCMEPGELNLPITLSWAVQNQDLLLPETKEKLATLVKLSEK